MRIYATLSTILALSFGGGVLLAHAASADNLVPTGNSGIFCDQGSSLPIGICQTDNANFYFHIAVGTHALEAPDRAALNDMLDAQYRPGDLKLFEEPNPVFDGPSETDWIFQEGPSRYQNPRIACHEVGHAVGLTHGAQAFPILGDNDTSLGCMRRPLGAITSDAIGPANKAQINSVY